MSPSASAAPSLHAENVSEKKECAIDTPTVQTEQPKSDRGWRFWLIFLALCLALFLTALDLVCLPPPGPPSPAARSPGLVVFTLAGIDIDSVALHHP